MVHQHYKQAWLDAIRPTNLHLYLQLLVVFFPDEGMFLSVFTADYGRYDQTTCSYNRPLKGIQNICSNPTSKVAERYNCLLFVNLSIRSKSFENLNHGVYKLQVSDSCSLHRFVWQSTFRFRSDTLHKTSTLGITNVTLFPQLQWKEQLYYQSQQLSVWRPLSRHLQVPAGGVQMRV